MFKMILALMFQGVFPMLLGLGGGQYNSQARQNETAATTAAGQFGGQAATEGATLNPLFMQDIRATHLYDPNQQNEMLTAAEGGSGGTFGGAEGVLNASAARTGNSTGLAKTLDEMARDKSKTNAGASEGIAAADVTGAKQLNQQGAAGMQGLYGTNTNAQLEAMKQANTDVATEQATQGQTWLQQLDQMAKFGGDVAKDISAYKGLGSNNSTPNS